MPHSSLWKNGDAGKIVRAKSPGMLVALYRSEGIVVHSLLNPLVLVLFALQPWLLRKANWVVWGGDLYTHRVRSSSFRARVLEAVRHLVVPRFRFVTTLIDGEYELAQEWYGAKGIPLRATYPGPQSYAPVAEPRKRPVDGHQVTVLVGNSATVTNHHKEALDCLAGLRDGAIRIVLPLSYGFEGYEAYADGVVDYAQRLFGVDAVQVLREQLAGSEYTRMLTQIDVGIFNNDRQQAMGNITQLLSMGAKVYLRPGTLMWGHFVRLGCVVHDIGEVAGLALDAFVYQSDEMRERNHAVMARRHDLDTKIRDWQSVFTAMRETIGRRGALAKGM
jgi:hypothetical protein